MMVQLVKLRLARVMRNAETFDVEIVQAEHASAFEDVFLIQRDFADLFAHRIPRALICVHVHPVTPGQDTDSLTVIGVLMRDEQTVDVF